MSNTFEDDAREYSPAVRQLLSEYIRSSFGGSPPDLESLIREHPECGKELQSALTRADDAIRITRQIVERASDSESPSADTYIPADEDLEEQFANLVVHAKRLTPSTGPGEMFVSSTPSSQIDRPKPTRQSEHVTGTRQAAPRQRWIVPFIAGALAASLLFAFVPKWIGRAPDLTTRGSEGELRIGAMLWGGTSAESPGYVTTIRSPTVNRLLCVASNMDGYVQVLRFNASGLVDQVGLGTWHKASAMQPLIVPLETPDAGAADEWFVVVCVASASLKSDSQESLNKTIVATRAFLTANDFAILKATTPASVLAIRDRLFAHLTSSLTEKPALDVLHWHVSR